ncbi:DUF3883 domain-containing protein [Bacillus wiedmannii]|uniref:DUF3883 domain-containing protein n=1 Tax=Bacillus wiedmannii TaxID=1890302 RepID=UPI0021CDEFFE|nr:DUF3883 domain-containing protein [Bacillus wiedmannii]MCU5518283.1 DUF3883 domain-containing protein [Bacillus wiedmannii]
MPISISNSTSPNTTKNTAPKTPTKKDYVKQQKKDLKIGRAGELLVLKNEKELLRNTEKHDVAKEVDHVSETQGDGLGFVIKSFTIEGEEKFIELKNHNRWNYYSILY